jgi:hypothetical protein
MGGFESKYLVVVWSIVKSQLPALWTVAPSSRRHLLVCSRRRNRKVQLQRCGKKPAKPFRTAAGNVHSIATKSARGLNRKIAGLFLLCLKL